MSMDADFDSLNHLEEQFYKKGFEEGFEHGKLHGIFEGRALGREKAFELWEEIGFYEGQARIWQGVMEPRTDEKSKKGLQHIATLLSMTDKFPLENNSQAPAESQLDMMALIKSIRARYRIMCSAVGTRPRLAAAPMDNSV